MGYCLDFLCMDSITFRVQACAGQLAKGRIPHLGVNMGDLSLRPGGAFACTVR